MSGRPSWDTFVVDGETGDLVKAQLFEGLADHNLKHHEGIWRPRLIEHNEHLKRLSIRTGYAEDAHWQWSRKVDHTAGQLGFKHFALEVDGNTEGLMILKLIANRSRLEPPKELVYIDYLSVAPANRSSIKKPPQFRAIGTVLFHAAVMVSDQEGMGGRIGLHSLPGAASWYSKLGLQDFGPDASIQNLNYFELAQNKAQTMLREMEND